MSGVPVSDRRRGRLRTSFDRSSADGDAEAPTTVLGAVAEVWEDSWNSSFAYPAATMQTVASNGLTYGRRYAGGSTN